VAGSRLHPQSFEGEHKKCDGAGKFCHEARKCLRRLPHDVIQYAAREQPR